MIDITSSALEGMSDVESKGPRNNCTCSSSIAKLVRDMPNVESTEYFNKGGGLSAVLDGILPRITCQLHGAFLFHIPGRRGIL